MGVQVDPPPIERGTQMTPPPLSSSSSSKQSRPRTQHNYNQNQGYYFDPNGRNTPVNYDDPNDHRNY